MEGLDKKMLTAAFDGDLATVEKLVIQGADINYTDPSGNFYAVVGVPIRSPAIIVR